MTIDEFRSNELLVTEFAEALKIPSVSHAIRTLKDAYLPLSSEPPTGVSFEVWNSHQNTRREGFFEAIRVIELMAKHIDRNRNLSSRNLMPNLVNEDNYDPNNNAE
jgi:DNA-binding transcriptional ArsR family regulator